MKKIFMLALLFLTGCSTINFVSRKDTNLKITGKIIDAQEKPVGNVEISTVPNTNIVFSNSLGEFMIHQRIKPDKFYTVMARYSWTETDSSSSDSIRNHNRFAEAELKKVKPGGKSITLQFQEYAIPDVKLDTHREENMSGSSDQVTGRPN